MACQTCFQSREDGAQYCRNCGDNLLTGEDPKHTANLLMALLGMEMLVGLLWLILQKGVIPFLAKDPLGNTNWQRIGPVYNIFGWITDAAVVITALVCLLLVKNTRARILFIVFLVFKIIFIIGYRIFNHI